MHPLMKKQIVINLKIATAKARARYRAMALAEFKDGETGYATAKKLHLSPQTISNWFASFRRNGGKLVAERRRGPAPGTCAKLDAKQLRKLNQILVDKTPDQLKFKFALWSSKAICAYVRETFGVSIVRRTARRYMNQLGFTYQVPARRAREQSGPAVARWIDEEYPAIRAEAAAAGATVLWGDETTNMSGDYAMRGYAPRGRTPILKAPDRRKLRCNSISAIGNRGDLFFMFFQGAMNTDIFKDFCERLIREFSDTPVFLIVDNLKVHHANVLKEWLKESEAEHGFRVFYLPSYSPELNPDEYLNRDVKAHLSEMDIPKSEEELRSAVESHLKARKADKETVKRFFEKPEVAYAAEKLSN